MPTPPIDTSRFTTGRPELSYKFDAEEQAEMAQFTEDALDYIMGSRSAVPIAELLLAFAAPPVLAVFLVRFERPIERGNGETEMWVITANGPSMCFETEYVPTPADALKLYCDLGEDWATRVRDGKDLKDCYPIPVERTLEHADMLMMGVNFIRAEVMPLARGAGLFSALASAGKSPRIHEMAGSDEWARRASGPTAEASSD